MTHVREEVLGARSSAAISGRIDEGCSTGDFLKNSSNAENELENLRSMHFNFDSIQVSIFYVGVLKSMRSVCHPF